MQYEFSKTEKKIVRQVIDIGLQRDLQSFISDIDHLVQEWKSKKLSNREAYQKIYNKVKENDKYIARMYDDLRGSTSMLTLQGLLANRTISEADLNGFSKKTRDDILKIMNILGNDKS
jgi:hypothetical protein